MAISCIYTVSRDDAEARNWLRFLRHHGYGDLSTLVIERVFWLEGAVDVRSLLPLVANPLYQAGSEHSMLDPGAGPIVEIAYRPAVTDPETPSILAGARALGQDRLEFARLSRRYQFGGLTAARAREAAGRFLYNPVVERVREPDEVWATLRPTGRPDPVRSISLAGLSEGDLCALSQERSWYAPLAQMRVIQAHETRQARPHTDAEIEILVQSWSDHCYHTTWKSLGLLKQLSQATADINHPLVVSAFKDNAGGMEFYEGWVVTVKGETHNFPSSIAPFGGISTKHGGVIRDTLGFGKGAYPVGGTTVMGTMDPRLAEQDVPAGALHPRLIVSESIRGTAYYVNPMGIPMMHPLYRTHPRYAKCFALGHSFGLIPKQYAIKETPQPGDIALLIGGETGRDGIHGATASSAGMTGETLSRESAAVQIGHPITERKFTTAIPVLRDAGLIRSITDLGAGGISSAAGEMAEKTGVELDLDCVPLKDRSLTAWEILLSESQERMLLAVAPENLVQAQAILDRYEVAHAAIGRFTSSRRFEASWQGQKVVDLEMSFLWAACPIEPVEVREPKRRVEPLRLPTLKTREEWSAAVHGVLGHYHCADQSPAGSRFDSTVQGRTVVGPYGGRDHRMPTNLAVSAPLRGKPYGLVTTVAFNPFYGDADPRVCAQLMVIEAITKAVVAGVDYREMVLCDNFYTPRLRPETAWDLREMVAAIAELSRALGVPFISGKDSSSGTFEAAGRRIDVPPTLAVATMGRVPDVSRVVTKEFKRAGNRLLLLGRSDGGGLGGSVYADLNGQRGDRLFEGYDASSIRQLWDLLLALRRERQYVSGAAIAEGGTLLRVFEASLGSGLGARIELAPGAAGTTTGQDATSFAKEEHFFGEFVGSVLLEIEPDVRLDALKVPYRWLGEVISQAEIMLTEGGSEVLRESLADLEESWAKTFREVVG
ncbi:MAG TPA: AIR synthase-related protein [Terriglobia bacterium]|nr:AIR synthase-related protein [Terriglobia bacterium]